jgi:hypothetical protein
MYLGTDKNKASGTAYRQTECAGCPQVLPKDFLPLFYHIGRGIYSSKLFLYQKLNLRKERGKSKWDFLQQR